MAFRATVLAVFLALVGLVVPATPGAVAAAEPAQAARAATGTVAVTIKTPAGVPGLVRLKAGSKTRAVAKKPAGTLVTTTVKVPVGPWTVVPQQVVDDSTVYRGTASRRQVRVRAGKTVGVTVTYRRAPSVSDLQVNLLEPTQVGLVWTAPSDSAEYAVRQADGVTPPATAADDTEVAVEGTTASLSGLTPGTSYSFSVFAREPGTTKWWGPVSTTVTTPDPAPDAEAATVVTNPSTVMITDPADVTTTVLAGKVQASIPAGTVPTVGQGWVLPAGGGLASGYLGKVVAVSSDGKTVTLEPAGLADVFDYVELNIPDMSAQGAQVTPRPGARRSVLSCSGTYSEKFTVDPTFDPFGRFSATLTKYEIFGKNLPVGMSFDSELGVELGLSASADVSVGAQCGLDLAKITVPFSIGPVPMLFVITPTVAGTISGKIKLSNLGFTARLGVSFDGYLGLGGDDHVDGQRIATGNILKPTIDSVGGSLNLTAGVTVTVGVGSGNPKAGAVVGVSGTMNPVDITATATTGSNCLEVEAQRSLYVSLEAKAWLGSWDFSRSIDIPGLDANDPYPGSPYHFPQGCIGDGEFRILSGTLDVTNSWSASCANDQGWCDDGPDSTSSFTDTESSSAHLQVAEPGPWASQWGDYPGYLTAPMKFSSWDYSGHARWHQSAGGCSWTDDYSTVGAMEFGSAYWETAASVLPQPETLDVELADYYYGDWSEEWSPSWWGSFGAWDTDFSNEYPRIKERTSYQVNDACGDDYVVEDYRPMEYLGVTYHWSAPEEGRRSGRTVTVTPIGECTPDLCQWRVDGNDTYEFRSDYADGGYQGSGSTTATWSYVIERRPLGSGEPAP